MEKSEFNLKEYILTSGKIDGIHIPKLRYFLMYLKEIKYEEHFADVDLFSMLDKQVLLDSLEFYIKKASPARNTAHDYRRAIMALCDLVCQEYEIGNDLVEFVAQRDEFRQEANSRIELLKEKKNRGCMSDEEFELIETRINEFFETDNLSDRIAESINESEKAEIPYYHYLVSAIAHRLVSSFALGNNDIAALKITDLRLEERVIEVNGIHLPVNNELATYFEILLKYRDLIIHKYNVHSDFLLLKSTGAPYLSENGNGNITTDNDTLWSLMNAAVKHTRVTSIKYRTICDLVAKGANVNLLRQLTGTTEGTIAKICRENMDDFEKDLNYILRSGNSIYTRSKNERGRKGMIRCPFCGEYRDAGSENWLLIQNIGEKKKYLACKECEGRDGEYHY